MNKIDETLFFHLVILRYFAQTRSDINVKVSHVTKAFDMSRYVTSVC